VQTVTNKIINTTVGRVILNDAIPSGMPFVNGLLKKKGLQQLVQSCYLKFGLEKTVEMLDSLKNLGFTYATRSGLSIGIDDLIIPQEKAPLVDNARNEVIKVEGQYLEGAITNGERYNKVIAVWSEVTEKIADAMFGEMPPAAIVSSACASVVHVMSYLMSPCCSSCSRRMVSLSGPSDHPSPKTSSVTPWRMSLCERPSAMSDVVAQLSMLMNPGATARPAASISARPRSRTAPMVVMRSLSIATSAANGVPPDPS